MHVRMTTIDGAPDVDKAVAVLGNDVLPAVKGHAGFRALMASADRGSGSISVLSIWDSEADEKASADQITKVREDSVKAMGGRLAEVRAYEQVLQDTAEAPKPGHPLVITSIKMDPAKIDTNLEFFKANVLPAIKSNPGFRSLRYLIDRVKGEGMVGVVLADDKAVKQYLDEGGARAEAASGQGVELGERVRRELIFAAI